MAKALVFSDLHLHSHKDSVDRLQDCLSVLNWIFDMAVEHEVDHILFLGDLFHERAKIDVLNYLRTFEVFMNQMIAKVPSFDMWLLIGNHDMYHKEKWDVNSVKPLSAIPNVNIVAEPSSIEIGGRLIDFCPHTENPIVELEKLKKGRSKSSMTLLLGHMAVHGAKLNRLYGTKADVIVEYDNDMAPVSCDIFNEWDMTLLGHYHGAQQLCDNVEYVGSPLQLSFGEAFEEKHIIILDLDTLGKTYVENEFSPKHFILLPKDLEQHDLKNNFVRVVVDGMGSKDLLDMRKEITEKYHVASLDFKEKEKKAEEEKAIVEDAKAMLYDENEMLETYVKNVPPPAGLDSKELIGIGKDICSKSN